MGSIYWTSDPVIGGTDDTKFIHCVDGQVPQIHELWFLQLDNITQTVHPTTQVEVGAGTVGEFTTNYLSENGHIIPIIRKLSINRNVHFWVFLILSG